MLHLRCLTGFSRHLECWNAFRYIWSIKYVLKEKLKKICDIQVWVLWRSSRGRPESASQRRPLNVRLGRPLDVISVRPQGVRLGRPWDIRSRRSRDDQIGSLGTSWGPIFAGWDYFKQKCRLSPSSFLI